AVIAADGMWSPIRRMLGAGVAGYRGEWHAFRQYVEHVTGPAAERLIVWFEPDLLPGYAWSFPLPGGRANIGFGVLRDGRLSGRDLAETWRDLLRREHVVDALGPGAEPIGRHTAWPIPARIDAMPLSSGRVLFVGDAAAATDVLTGEGIGQALLTGRVAAESILAGTDPADRAAKYEQAVRHHLFADHRMSNRMGKVLASRRGADVALNIVERSGSWGRRNFARWMFEDEPRAIALTPSRWHRSVLRRPGVWRDHHWPADSAEPSAL
ncbi:MAG: FAD-dependent monooxygenase, partial [Ilumatobacteraceae bacterium]